MRILASSLYEEQLKAILEPAAKEHFENTKKFKLYLDTVIINLATKLQKYKKSVYFDDERIKDIDFQGYTIPFYIDEETSTFVVLGILKQ